MHKKGLTIIIPSSRSNPAILRQFPWFGLQETVSYQILLVTDNITVYKNRNNFKKIQFYYTRNKNASTKRNLGARLAIYPLLGFIDDDCIPSKNWFSELLRSFQGENSEIIFGKTVPYQKRKHSDLEFCPGTFSMKLGNPSKTIKVPHHADYIGCSNNFAIRKNLFLKLGGFKTWLGPSSPGMAGEDIEFIVNSLETGAAIKYNNKMLVYHDKWLSRDQNIIQNCSYICGGIAAYGYYAIKGIPDCKQHVIHYLNIAREGIFECLWYIKRDPLSIMRQNIYILKYILYSLRGVLVATYYGINI